MKLSLFKITSLCLFLNFQNISTMNHEIDSGNNKNTVASDRCGICWQSYQPNDLIAVLHKSKHPHYFHENCIILWYDINKRCPYCQHEISLTECFGFLSTNHKLLMYTGEFMIGTLSLIGLADWLVEKSINKIYSLNNDFHYKERRQIFKDEKSLRIARWSGYAAGTVSKTYILWKSQQGLRVILGNII